MKYHCESDLEAKILANTAESLRLGDSTHTNVGTILATLSMLKTQQATVIDELQRNLALSSEISAQVKRVCGDVSDMKTVVKCGESSQNEALRLIYEELARLRQAQSVQSTLLRGNIVVTNVGVFPSYCS